MFIIPAELHTFFRKYLKDTKSDVPKGQRHEIMTCILTVCNKMCILYTSIFSYKKKKQVEKDLLSEYGEGGQIKNKRKSAAAASSRMILLKGSRVHSNNQ